MKKNEYIVFRLDKKLSLTFNQVAEYLKKNPDISIKDQLATTEAYLVETDSKTIDKVKDDLKGWIVTPNGKMFTA